MTAQYEGMLSEDPACGRLSGGGQRERLCREMVGWHGSVLHGSYVLMLVMAGEGQDYNGEVSECCQWDIKSGTHSAKYHAPMTPAVVALNTPLPTPQVQ